jgi:serine protease Do
LSDKKGEFEVCFLNKTLVTFLLILCLSFPPCLAFCAVYGWVDAQGTYHFAPECPTGRTCRLIVPDKPEGTMRDKFGAPPAKTGSATPMRSFAWPSWTGSRPPIPKPIRGEALVPADLFRASSISVYTVIATSNQDTKANGESNTAIGSAVAISSRQLITNCHIVKTRPIIYIKRGDIYDLVRLLYAQPDTDRCYLHTDKIQVNPVRGMRPYDDLAVGERVYTIGAPAGLENTLGEGLISGLRKDGEIRLIQTSAPISRGSSGGGLFDARGNLLGITTLFLSESQNLNFAISAEDYWR